MWLSGMSSLYYAFWKNGAVSHKAWLSHLRGQAYTFSSCPFFFRNFVSSCETVSGFFFLGLGTRALGLGLLNDLLGDLGRDGVVVRKLHGV